MILYSFYDPEKGIIEILRDHILTALTTFNVNSKLVKVGQTLNENFYKILNYSIIFHDFGKILFNQYMYNPNKRLDFSGHEIISCYATNMYLTKIFERGDSLTNLDKKIVLLAILFHHHPMKIKERLQKLERIGNMTINAETFQAFYQQLNGITDIPPVSIKISKNVIEIVTEMRGRGGLVKELWREVWMNPDGKIKKTFLLVIQGLISADYASALKWRKNGMSEFAKTVQLFLKFYA